MTIPALAAGPLVNRIRAMAGLDRVGEPTTTGGQLRVAGSGTEVSVKATVRDQGDGLEEARVGRIAQPRRPAFCLPLRRVAPSGIARAP